MNTPLWTALITPFDEKGDIHFDDLESIVRLQEHAGNGILLLGSTGEGLALGDDEKKSVVDFVTGLKPSVPLMAGVGGFNLKHQQEWVQYLNESEVDALLPVMPLYAKPGLAGQVLWFRSILDAAKKPCMLYNIPSRTGAKLNPEVLSKLADHPNMWAVKEASGSVVEYQALKKSAPGIEFYSGDDALLPFFATAGCSGLVSVSSNVWPDETRAYVEESLNGQTQNLFPLWSDAVKALFSSPNPVPVKVLMKEKGMIQTSVLRPPLTADDTPDRDRLLASDNAIKHWYSELQ
ncbi:MAG: 4-hydroxy-tetrahydrodipicolinate synthase [Bacteroidetes bacterium]|jgi:4-hydroxy-tetrahydrodipicolinate synthase|nr:4-hydroxy-tetrahydrodipicolinate synthase [Bacteroidota bacterium]